MTNFVAPYEDDLFSLPAFKAADPLRGFLDDLLSISASDLADLTTAQLDELDGVVALFLDGEGGKEGPGAEAEKAVRRDGSGRFAGGGGGGGRGGGGGSPKKANRLLGIMGKQRGNLLAMARETRAAKPRSPKLQQAHREMIKEAQGKLAGLRRDMQAVRRGRA